MDIIEKTNALKINEHKLNNYYVNFIKQEITQINKLKLNEKINVDKIQIDFINSGKKQDYDIYKNTNKQIDDMNEKISKTLNMTEVENLNQDHKIVNYSPEYMHKNLNELNDLHKSKNTYNSKLTKD